MPSDAVIRLITRLKDQSVFTATDDCLATNGWVELINAGMVELIDAFEM